LVAGLILLLLPSYFEFKLFADSWSAWSFFVRQNRETDLDLISFRGTTTQSAIQARVELNCRLPLLLPPGVVDVWLALVASQPCFSMMAKRKEFHLFLSIGALLRRCGCNFRSKTNGVMHYLC
jgi:hypothetical protein